MVSHSPADPGPAGESNGTGGSAHPAIAPPPSTTGPPPPPEVVPAGEPYRYGYQPSEDGHFVVIERRSDPTQVYYSSSDDYGSGTYRQVLGDVPAGSGVMSMNSDNGSGTYLVTQTTDGRATIYHSPDGGTYRPVVRDLAPGTAFGEHSLGTDSEGRSRGTLLVTEGPDGTVRSYRSTGGGGGGAGFYEMVPDEVALAGSQLAFEGDDLTGSAAIVDGLSATEDETVFANLARAMNTFPNASSTSFGDTADRIEEVSQIVKEIPRVVVEADSAAAASFAAQG